MSKRRTTLLALVLLYATPSLGFGQVQSDALEVLRNVGVTYGSMTTFQAEGTMTTEMSGPSMQNKMDLPLTLTAALPSKMRIESKSSSLGMLLIFDGQTGWMYMPQLNTYSKMPFGASAPGSAGGGASLSSLGGMINNYEHLADRLKEAKILRSEAMPFGGSSVDCYVVEVEPSDAQTQSAAKPIPVKVQSTTMDLWVSKDRFLVLRQSTDTRMTEGSSAAPTEMKSTMTFSSVKVNDPVPDSLFVFTPPAGAKQMDLSAFMPSGTPSPSPPQK